MFTYCPDCEVQTAAVEVDHDAERVRCPECGAARRFRSLPLHVVLGASGVGKTTVWRRLAGTVGAVVLDWDVMTFDEDGGYGEAFGRLSGSARAGFWLRLVGNVHRSGVPVVLFAGGITPDRLESRPESRYAPMRYLGLTCDPDVQRERLRDRRGFEWARDAGEPWADLDRQVALNEAIAGLPPERDVVTVDTGTLDPEAVTERVREWVREGLS